MNGYFNPQNLKLLLAAEKNKLTREAVSCMLGFELAHIGVNTTDEKKARQIASQFALLFNFALKTGENSCFAGPGIEVMKSKGLGQHGHIAIWTNTMARTIAYLHRIGVAVDMKTAKKNSEGSIIEVYLSDDIGGFAVQLLQRIK